MKKRARYNVIRLPDGFAALRLDNHAEVCRLTKLEITQRLGTMGLSKQSQIIPAIAKIMTEEADRAYRFATIGGA